MQAEAWEIAWFLENYAAVVPAEFSRIHGDDERVSVATFRQGVIDHRAIIEAAVHDRRQFEGHADHSGLTSGKDGPIREAIQERIATRTKCGHQMIPRFPLDWGGLEICTLGFLLPAHMEMII